jgi:hypothetical protein
MELQEFKIPEPCNTYLDWQHTSSLDMRIHQPGFLQLGFLQTNFLQAGFDRMNKISRMMRVSKSCTSCPSCLIFCQAEKHECRLVQFEWRVKLEMTVDGVAKFKIPEVLRQPVLNSALMAH